jgi:hypothetical protein
MTPEERELLTKSIKLSEENNRILKGIRRGARISSFLRLLYWLLILGAAFGTYYFVQPYLDAVIKSYNQMQKGIETVTNVKTKLPTIPEMPALPAWLGGATTTKK